MLSIHLTKPPSQGAKPHCAPTGLSLRGCGRPEAMTLAVCAEVFLGRASDRSIPWQQEASLPGTAQAPFLTGDGGWQEHGPGTSKPHLRKHTRGTPRAGPAPAQRTPSGRWLQGKSRVTTGKGQARDQQLHPVPTSHPQGRAVHRRVVTIARLESSNIKHRLSITGATWPQSRKEAFRRQPHGQASPGLEPQSSLPGCPPSERETKLFACLLVGLF